MQFYTRQHRHYCGVDLHARTMCVCVLDRDGNVLVSRNIASALSANISETPTFLEISVEGGGDDYGTDRDNGSITGSERGGSAGSPQVGLVVGDAHVDDVVVPAPRTRRCGT
jgi:hypothetical protein